MRDLVEHDVPDLVVGARSASPAASRVIGPPKMLILLGSTPLYVLYSSRQRYAAVQAEARLPVGRLLDSARSSGPPPTRPSRYRGTLWTVATVTGRPRSDRILARLDRVGFETKEHVTALEPLGR